MCTENLTCRYEQATGTPDLADGLARVVPLNAPRRPEWRVCLSYWGTAPFKPGDRKRIDAFYEDVRWQLRALVVAAVERGEIRKDLNASVIVDQIIQFTEGLGVRATLDPKAWPPIRK